MRAVQADRTYLGDGVYARLDELGVIWLTVENGIEAIEEIALEPEVYQALVRFAAAESKS